MAKLKEHPLLMSFTSNSSWNRLWPVILIWLLIGTLDLSRRFLPEFGEVATEVQADVLTSKLRVHKLDADLYEMYLSKLGDQTASELSVMGDLLEGDIKAAEVFDVNGSWREGDSSYYLLAIFGGEKSFAVIDRYDHPTAVNDTLQVRVGDVVGVLTVTGITALTLELTGLDGERINLALFAPSVADDGMLNLR